MYAGSPFTMTLTPSSEVGKVVPLAPKSAAPNYAW